MRIVQIFLLAKKHLPSYSKTFKQVADMEFVKKFTPPDFRAKNFTPSISPNFNSFSKKKHKKMSENGEIYTAGKNFTLPPALTALTNSTSVWLHICKEIIFESFP